MPPQNRPKAAVNVIKIKGNPTGVDHEWNITVEPHSMKSAQSLIREKHLRAGTRASLRHQLEINLP